MILSSEFPSSSIHYSYLYHYQITYLVIIDDPSTTWQPPPVWISRVKHFWREAGAGGAKLTIFRPLVHRSALVMWPAPLCISLPCGCRPGTTGCPMSSPDVLLKPSYFKTRSFKISFEETLFLDEFFSEECNREVPSLKLSKSMWLDLASVPGQRYISCWHFSF